MFDYDKEKIYDLADNGELEYEDVSDLIEYLIKAKSEKINQTIGAYDKDDIEQELRIKCFRVIKRYSSDKGDISNFLGVCIDNALIDLMRKHTLRKSNVCFYCLCYHKGECKYYKDTSKCKKYSKFLEKKKEKESISMLRGNSSFEWRKVVDQGNNLVGDENIAESVAMVREKLSPGSKHFFDLIRKGKSIKEEQKVILFQEVKFVIQKYIC